NPQPRRWQPTTPAIWGNYRQSRRNQLRLSASTNYLVDEKEDMNAVYNVNQAKETLRISRLSLNALFTCSVLIFVLTDVLLIWFADTALFSIAASKASLNAKTTAHPFDFRFQ